MQKIGILGGTFNPIHLGHIQLAEALLSKHHLDKILLIPAARPPHKPAPDLIAGKRRLAMCRLAAQNNPQLEVSDIELQRNGQSYTADTLEQLQGVYPGAVFYLITGADMFLTLRDWVSFEKIIKNAVLCGVTRAGTNAPDLYTYAKKLESLGAETIVEELNLIDASSTEIRALIRSGRDYQSFTHPAVAQYIKENALYQQ